LGAEECRWSLALYPGHQSRAGNLARTNQPATVYRDRPEEFLKTLARKKKLSCATATLSCCSLCPVATLNPRTREFRYVNAGHNPPVLVKQASGALMRLDGRGPVVGMLPFANYEAPSVTLEPGDLLIVYTDGISEARLSALMAAFYLH
jgi:serine phosphatase RsbU (regulator of sigma subunit)